jgi:hypothetical protein
MMTIGLLGDFDADTRMLGYPRRKILGFWGVSVKDAQDMDALQKSVIFCSKSPKGYGHKKIHTRLIAADRRDACLAGSVKYWVRKYDSGR